MELEYDADLIDLLNCISSENQKTVREIASSYNQPVPKIYREIRLLESLQLVEIDNERPMRVRKTLNADVLKSIAEKAKQHLDKETSRRMASINTILDDHNEKHLSEKETSEMASTESTISSEKNIDHLEVIEPADLNKVLNYHKMLLKQEKIMIIYPFELLNIEKETVIKKGIERFHQEFSKRSSIRETRVLVLFFDFDIQSIEDIFSFLDFAMFEVLAQSEKIIVKKITDKHISPILFSEKFAIMPLFSLNYDKILYLFRIFNKDILESITIQFNQLWLDAIPVQEFTRQEFCKLLKKNENC